jgi:hypothetical protein
VFHDYNEELLPPMWQFFVKIMNQWLKSQQQLWTEICGPAVKQLGCWKRALQLCSTSIEIYSVVAHT